MGEVLAGIVLLTLAAILAWPWIARLGQRGRYQMEDSEVSYGTEQEEVDDE